MLQHCVSLVSFQPCRIETCLHDHHPPPLTSFIVAVQVNWQLGSAVFGLLLRRYAPHDTYTVSRRLCLSLMQRPAACLLFLLSRDPFLIQPRRMLNWLSECEGPINWSVSTAVFLPEVQAGCMA